MNATFSIDSEMTAEMKRDAASILRHNADDLDSYNITLDAETPCEPGILSQTPQTTQPAEPSREARIAHYTKLVETGEPLFPCDETDDSDGC